MIRGPQPEASSGKDRNIVALLSLQLLLLAFFILLNSLSKFEDEKTRRVLESVNDAFNGDVQAVRNTSSYSGALGSLTDSRSLIAELQQLFNTSLPATKIKQNERAGLFRLELSVDALFRTDTAEFRPGRLRLVGRVAKILKQRSDAGQDFQLRLFYGVATTAERRFGVPQANLLELRRTSRFIEEMEARGVAARHLALGFEPASSGILALEIRLEGGAGQDDVADG